MYFQPSLIASTPTKSTDPLAIPVKKGEIIIAVASEGECVFEGEKFQKLFLSFLYVMLFKFMFWIIVDGL